MYTHLFFTDDSKISNTSKYLVFFNVRYTHLLRKYIITAMPNGDNNNNRTCLSNQYIFCLVAGSRDAGPEQIISRRRDVGFAPWVVDVGHCALKRDNKTLESESQK